MPDLEIWTDGACRDNGTPRARGGYGVYFEDNHRLKGALYPGTPQTNQRAELVAVLKALKEARRRQRKGDYYWSQRGEGLDVTIVSDSKYAVDGCSKWLNTWVENGFRDSNGRPVKNEDIFSNIFEQLIAPEFNSVKFRHVPAHSGEQGNHIADRLANEAIDEAICA